MSDDKKQTYPEMAMPAVHCTKRMAWVKANADEKPLKYVNLMITYEVGHAAKSEEVRNHLLSEIFDHVLDSIATAAPDVWQ